MPHTVTELLEPIVVGAVAITARALSAAGADLTFLQWRLLLVLGEHPNGATVTDLAGRVGVNLSPASRLVGRLARRGLVATGPDANDRRATRVTLTPAGEDLRRQVLERRGEDLRAVLAEAELSRREREGLARVSEAFGRRG